MSRSQVTDPPYTLCYSSEPISLVILSNFYSVSSPESTMVILDLGLPDPEPAASSFITTSMPSITAHIEATVRRVSKMSS